MNSNMGCRQSSLYGKKVMRAKLKVTYEIMKLREKQNVTKILGVLTTCSITHLTSLCSLLFKGILSLYFPRVKIFEARFISLGCALFSTSSSDSDSCN